jgi:hypothetical protein
MLVKERAPTWRTVEAWAIATLLETGAIKKCHDHGYMQCRGDPDAFALAFDVAREEPPAGLSVEEALAALRQVLSGMGDICPEC